jgi:phosphatidate cytidylyltransferase
MMGVFSYVYYWAYVSRPEVTVPDVLQSAMKLGDAQQVELFVKLGNLLAGEGILPGGCGCGCGCVGGAALVCSP